ncbi:hypothetical protein [Granulosicoccus antarcticus]|uniref:Uncharacterized protein n=1 Tax=Granulosicoccus antarcticus IMCC3135 TaxID=1192854 RepID=A0A2Z2NNI2_9GAMM|nr:hypothetical protein [Granulosicoccus antarcticus]ASJ71298.1 hypothetical protein IMCC3135_05930 [Granulosicoccus antarcticus IMCC3135]
MNPVIISTEALRNAPRALTQPGLMSTSAARQTRFSDLPLPARLLLAVPRARGRSATAPIAERYVLDTLGRIIDGGPDRKHTIEAVNMLADVLLNQNFDDDRAPANPEWLSTVENHVLCMLCKINAGQAEQAALIARHCLEGHTLEAFSQAATALCGAECFKRGGSHVFTPSWRGMPSHNGPTEHRSVTLTKELSLGESLLLNTIRLRKRTLSYSGLGARVVPLLCQHVALPELQTVVDAHMVEALRHSAHVPDIRCLCCPAISADEAVFLGSLAEFAGGDTQRCARQLSAWLPLESVNKLLSKKEGFQSILRQIGTPLPTRQWDMRQLQARDELDWQCGHVKETPMIH